MKFEVMQTLIALISGTFLASTLNGCVEGDGSPRTGTTRTTITTTTTFSSATPMLTTTTSSSAAPVWPDCGLSMRDCCDQALFKNLGPVFNFNGSGAGRGYTQMNDGTGPGSILTKVDQIPTCSLLNLIDAEQGEAMCKTRSPDTTSVCTAIEGSPAAQQHLISGWPVVGLFLEPGTCDELKMGQSSKTGLRAFTWQAVQKPTNETKTCWGLDATIANATVARTTMHLRVSLSCPAETSGGLGVEALWLSEQDIDNPNVNLCDHNPGNALDVVLTEASWTSAPLLPRWTCFDIESHTVSGNGAGQYRALLMSVGSIPCQVPSTKTIVV